MLANTVNQHRAYGGAIRVGRGLLAKIRRRDCTDMLLVVFGIVFFLSVVLYIALDRFGLLRR